MLGSRHWSELNETVYSRERELYDETLSSDP